MKHLLEGATLDVRTVNQLIEWAVEHCLIATNGDRDDEYDRSMFWELYKRIADEFIYDFGEMGYEIVPLRWCETPEIYLSGLWKGYFMNEVSDLIRTDERFADLIDGALANKKKYFHFTERIDAILRERFSVRES
jgi:hypothetical protein